MGNMFRASSHNEDKNHADKELGLLSERPSSNVAHDADGNTRSETAEAPSKASSNCGVREIVRKGGVIIVRMCGI